ncbi:response regulator [Fervidobacterium sp.]
MDFLEVFIQELLEKGQQSIDLIKLYIETKDPSALNELYRLFHTIKGSASLVGFSGFKELFHKIEDYFKRHMSGENVLTNDFLARVLSILPEILKKQEDITDDELSKYIDVIEGRATTGADVISSVSNSLPAEILQDLLSNALSAENSLMRDDSKNALREIRAVKQKIVSLIQSSYYIQLKQLLSNFDVLVLQEATINNKRVKLELEIGDEKIEKKDSKMLVDMLVHLVRNSIAHGIESPEVRIQRNKPEVGRITIRSYVRENELFLEIEDDGNGIDFEKVRKKAAEKNLSHMRPEDVIFVPGFSTKDQVDGTSGHGIGLDVVKNFSTVRGGDAEVVTTPGKGTKFIVHFPIKTFLIRVLVVEADGLQFCIDINDILEVISQPNVTNNQVKHKDKLYEITFNCSSPRFGLITKSNTAILVSNLLGSFDGQVSNENYDTIKGFVKNIFVYPLPIISAEKFRKLEKEEDSGNMLRVRKILLVDDSIVTRTLVGKFLRNFGYNVIEAADGESAIEVFKKEKPDIVICDVEMPGINGFETTRRLKEIEKETPVIIFSTLTNEQLIQGLEVGASANLSKDEPPERLIRLIEKFLR